MVRGCEVAFQREMMLENLVFVELGSVVQGECFEMGLVFFDGRNGSPNDLSSCS
jgi:hypothetical protein